MSSAEDTPPPRPYTEYNIFFQIERGKYLLVDIDMEVVVGHHGKKLTFI